MSVLAYILLSLTLASYSCDAYRALVVYPLASKSHGILGDGVVRQLLKDGYEVVYLSHYEYKNAPANLRVIDITNNSIALPGNPHDVKKYLGNKFTPHYNHIRRMMILRAAKILENEELQQLMSDPNEHFDVVIAEWMFTEVMAGLAALFECPLIWVSPSEANPTLIGLIDATPNPAYSPGTLSSNLTPLDFWQRAEELWTHFKISFLNYLFHEEKQADAYNFMIAPIIEKRGRTAPHFSEVQYNASLILGNSHISTGLAIGLPQNYKHIGGFHINEEVQPLPKDLAQIMESATDGVIYFSMGSNLKSKDWPEEIKMGLLKMFGELKQTVLWKFEEDLPNKPSNLHILQWAPQPSILSHPNCSLFITHGGLLSTTETIHYGVPIIGVPTFGDQFLNVKRAVQKGYALQVDLTYNLAADLKVAIEEILSKPTYRERVQELSFLYHDRPVKPAQELSHWVRHVIETGGAPHLRSAALNVPLYKRLYLDLIAMIVVVVIYITKSIKRFYANLFGEKKKEE